MVVGSLISGDLTQKQRHLHSLMKMVRIMFHHLSLQYFHISFHLSQVPGPVTGPILASVFGWVPVLLWLIVGGLFFGAVQDFGALYASVKNEGKSMGMIIEKYIGKTGRKLFMLFCWLFTLLVIAAFTDMVAGTFVAKGVEGMTEKTANADASAASISMLFIVVAIIFGLVQKSIAKAGKKMNEWVKAIVAIVLLVAMFAVGMALPIYATKSAWIYIIMAYLFLASVMPMWLLMQPRDYMTTFMLLGMIIGAVLGVVVAHPSMNLNAFNGFTVGSGASKQMLFPTLFVTIACGAVSGFHSLVSSGTSSKTISNEKDMPMVGYGAMVVESLLGIISLVVVGCSCSKWNKAWWNTFCNLFKWCCRIFGKIRITCTGCNSFHDNVCISISPYIIRFSCQNRKNVIPGIILWRHNRHIQNACMAEGFN